jgi:Leucine-rich repeat (LRR) protein
MQDPKALGNKQEAARRLLEALEMQSRSLDLHNLGLNTLPPGLELLSLAHLNLSCNSLQTLGKEIERCQHLCTLDIQHNQLSSLPNLEACTRLQELLADNNQLESLLGIEHCTQLSRLSAENNRLTSLPNLEACTRLQELYLSHNQLKSLVGIATCIHLLWLKAPHNQLTRLPPFVKGMQLLQLSLDHNPLRSCKEVHVCKELKIFHVDPHLQSLEGIEELPQLSEFKTWTGEAVKRVQIALRMKRCDEDLLL